MFILFFILYIPFILKGFGFLSRFEKLFKFLPDWIGRVEYLLSPLRDQIVSFVLLGYGIYNFIIHQNLSILGFCIAAFLSSRFNWFFRNRFRLDVCRWILKTETIEPNYFFRIYYRGIGSFSNQLPLSVPQVNYSYLDYRTGSPSRKTIWPLLAALADTLTIAKLAILAMQKLSLKEGVDAFDFFGRMWGARAAARTHLKIITREIEQIPPLSGKVLLVFNHRGYGDFALNFFALGDLKNGNRHLRPRFIAAKDHFIDNPFLYSWLGIGKCIEKGGMIFINRQKGKGWLAMEEAAQKLIEEEVEVAVYPQGTRAFPMSNEKGERMDAGYYTTFTKRTFEDPLGHLKIGTAQLILDTAMELRRKKREPLTVLFIGIRGSATFVPKKSFFVQTESEIEFNVSHAWRVELPEGLELENPRGKPASTDPEKNYFGIIGQLQRRIDRELEKAIGWNESLMERFLTSPTISLLCKERGEGDDKLLKEFLISAHQNHHNLPFMILDRIYTLPANHWEKYLREFRKLILSSSNENEWKDLNRRVSLELLKEKTTSPS